QRCLPAQGLPHRWRPRPGPGTDRRVNAPGAPGGPGLYRDARVRRCGHAPDAVEQALLAGALAAYAAGDMDRARLEVRTPHAGSIDTSSASGTTLRSGRVLPKTQS